MTYVRSTGLPIANCISTAPMARKENFAGLQKLSEVNFGQHEVIMIQ